MAIGPVAPPLVPGALEGLTAQMAGMTAQEAYDRYTDKDYLLSDDIQIGYGTKTTITPAISGDSSNTVVQSQATDPLEGFNEYEGNKSEVTGGALDGSNGTAIAYAIMKTANNLPEAVQPVAVPFEVAMIAIGQALGISMDAANMDVETKRKFSTAMASGTAAFFDKAKEKISAWRDALGNILFPKDVVEKVDEMMKEEGIGGDVGRSSDLKTNWTQPIKAYPALQYNSPILGGMVRVKGDYILIENSVPGMGYASYIIASDHSGKVGEEEFPRSGQPALIVNVNTSYTFTHNGKTVYFSGNRSSNSAINYGSPSVNNGVQADGQTAWTAVYGIAAGVYPEGTDASAAPAYTPSQLIERGAIMGANAASVPVVPINIPDNPYNSIGSTKDPQSPSPDDSEGVKAPPIPMPYPDTNVSNPDVPLVNSSVINSTLINELVEELANTVDPQPSQSSGIVPIPYMPGIVTPGETPSIDYPSIVPASGGGLIHVYNPTPGEFVSFGNWLWVTYADATIEKIWNNPFDGIIGAFELYCTPPTDGADNIRSGFLTCPTTAALVRQRYTEIDCGTIILPEYYGNYLDYSPYSQCYIYLPFIGINEVSIDDIVGHAINIRYRIDCYNGSCIAMIFVAKNGYRNLCYQFAGNCAVEVPLAGGSQAAIKAGVMQAEAYARSSMANAALSGASAIGMGAMGGMAGALLGGISALGSVAGAWYGGQQNIEAARVANKSSVQHSGQFGASHGAMGMKTPFIIVRNPVQVKVVNYNEDYGYPAHKRVIIGGCQGFLRVREVHVISAHATDAEKAAIEAALKAGVYVS